MKKSELRKIYKQKRKELSEDIIRLNSLEILHQLKQIDIFSFDVFHVFLPIEKQNELYTWFIIEFLKMKNKTIVVSVSDFQTNDLKHFVLEKETILKNNSYGIPEPINVKEIDVDKIEVVFVPLLISDKNNHRVGYGKGFYDRFLSECDENVQTIGLNFFEPIEKIEDINQNDVSLKVIIHAKGKSIR